MYYYQVFYFWELPCWQGRIVPVQRNVKNNAKLKKAIQNVIARLATAKMVKVALMASVAHNTRVNNN